MYGLNKKKSRTIKIIKQKEIKEEKRNKQGSFLSKQFCLLPSSLFLLFFNLPDVDVSSTVTNSRADSKTKKNLG